MNEPGLRDLLPLVIAYMQGGNSKYGTDLADILGQAMRRELPTLPAPDAKEEPEG